MGRSSTRRAVGVEKGGYMKRNWDTIREILTMLEERDEPVRLMDFPHERSAEISYNVEIMIEAGLVVGQISKTLGRGAKEFVLFRLTWDGHEFLDTIRSDTVWQKTKKSFVSNGLSMPFDLIKSVATDVTATLIKSTLGA